jgi:acyl-CoA thioesterase
MDHLASFERVAVNRDLGMRLMEHRPDSCTIAMPASERHTQGEGLIQGGILSALADTAAVYLLLPTLRERETCTSIEFKLNFLAPARAGEDELVARSRILQRGGKIAVCAADIEQRGKRIATGLFTYLLFERAQ